MKSENINQVFARNVMRICGEQGIQITKFAVANHLSRDAVYSGYRGERNTTLNTVQAWADALGVSVVELLTDKGDVE